MSQDRRVPASAAELKLSYAPIVQHVQPAVVNVYAAKVVRDHNPLLDDPIFRRFFGNPGAPPARKLRQGGSRSQSGEKPKNALHSCCLPMDLLLLLRRVRCSGALAVCAVWHAMAPGGRRYSGFSFVRVPSLALKCASESSLPKFEDCLQRLETIVNELEKGDVSLDRALELCDEGMKLSGSGRKELEEAEGKVEILMRRGGR